MFPMGYGGLALAPSVAFSLSGLLGLYFIRKKIDRPLDVISVEWVWRSFAALTSMAVVLFFYGFLLPYVPSAGLWVRAWWCVGAVAAGGFTYAAATLAMKFDECRWIKDALRKRRE